MSFAKGDIKNGIETLSPRISFVLFSKGFYTIHFGIYYTLYSTFLVLIKSFRVIIPN